MRDPVPHRTEPRGDEAIAALSAMPLLRQETRIKQDAEVLGDGLGGSSGNVPQSLGKEIVVPPERGGRI